MKNIKTKRQELLQKFSPFDYGSWQIYGEDTSTGDWAARAYYPLLDTVKGYYADIVEYALSLENFFTWGAGGHIKRLKVTEIGPGGGTVDTQR